MRVCGLPLRSLQAGLGGGSELAPRKEKKAQPGWRKELEGGGEGAVCTGSRVFSCVCTGGGGGQGVPFLLEMA